MQAEALDEALAGAGEEAWRRRRLLAMLRHAWDTRSSNSRSRSSSSSRACAAEAEKGADKEKEKEKEKDKENEKGKEKEKRMSSDAGGGEVRAARGGRVEGWGADVAAESREAPQAVAASDTVY
jgi:hypothetical protein